MSFQRSAQSWRARLHLSGARLPVLVGVTAVAIVVMVCAGRLLLDAASSEGFAVVQPGDAEQAAGDGDAEAAADAGASQAAPAPLRVHVGGAVAAPGVYDLAEGARVLDAVEAAGGFAEGAARDALNLARAVSDGEQVVVPSEADIAAQEAVSAGAGGAAAGAGASAAAGGAGGKVNINTASAAQLDTLPGVGASTAEKIVADREANGPFKTVEDLKRVSGIGDKKFAALADAICVG
ncbi:MAG: ComEA family DNA-binding protein [Gordonibacter pamelaeae]|uniref:Competence protein ComEA n=2 Tax=Gordonibacter pamelaeae TaxID=471189 RepID=A0A369M314_9ACTN|nr:ComEA family DNA-binding protein [Gordonibacter pamelaeae]HJH74951.1 ComEA family DNA-binding protein [Eggerthellaceae bacterium]MBS4896545.1 ComEA family DNA-binding protein [Gordonibacter pamelaeae]MCQ4848181.1 ComEA family DNA-binding protein [Gordonibacter pamelaeae]MCQ4849432.1 ComEA family DNA-binding protein [Gordonibacter pamelaeae]RDB65814.1 competence protein ComEA [Gordonibacter pamelaeae]